jgi:hypothetical protein
VNGSVYQVTSGVKVPSGVTLSIEPGVGVQFNTSAGMAVDNGGRLIVVGTSNAPIVFTRSGANGTTWAGITIRRRRPNRAISRRADYGCK